MPAPFYVGPLSIPPDAYYVHHPVLVPLLITAAVALLGEHEWAVKLVPISCSILSALFLWLLVAEAMGRRAAAFAVSVFVTLPMELHYGDFVNFEPCFVMWMLAALICLRFWRLRQSSRWAMLVGLCCLFALWTDWPGYLFTGAISLWLFLKRERRSRRLAILLLTLALSSGVIFFLQLRHVNPEAWRDFTTAVTMRVGNGVQPGSSPTAASEIVRFGFWEWVQRILQGLDQNYLRLTWVFVLAGAIYLFRHRKSTGSRWIGGAALFMIAAGIPYLVILRNWSFVHDFASFSLIGSIAILGGVGTEAIWEWAENHRTIGARRAVAIATALLLPSIAWAGFNRAEEQRSQFLILDGAVREPANLIPDLGRSLAATFPADTTILCNFDAYYSPLSYYAKRTIVRNLSTVAEWNFAAESEPRCAGGIVWPGAPSAPAIIATLPVSEISEVEIDGVRFVIWRRRD